MCSARRMTTGRPSTVIRQAGSKGCAMSSHPSPGARRSIAQSRGEELRAHPQERDERERGQHQVRDDEILGILGQRHAESAEHAGEGGPEDEDDVATRRGERREEALVVLGVAEQGGWVPPGEGALQPQRVQVGREERGPRVHVVWWQGGQGEEAVVDDREPRGEQAERGEKAERQRAASTEAARGTSRRLPLLDAS